MADGQSADVPTIAVLKAVEHSLCTYVVRTPALAHASHPAPQWGFSRYASSPRPAPAPAHPIERVACHGAAFCGPIPLATRGKRPRRPASRPHRVPLRPHHRAWKPVEVHAPPMPLEAPQDCSGGWPLPRARPSCLAATSAGDCLAPWQPSGHAPPIPRARATKQPVTAIEGMGETLLHADGPPRPKETRSRGGPRLRCGRGHARLCGRACLSVGTSLKWIVYPEPAPLVRDRSRLFEAFSCHWRTAANSLRAACALY